ncbi:FAD-dependent oxidoreductase [Altererythrobacter sp. ZODW24]|uniref:NAD(P)/FAD-dependent oxidoreductase n=1 Tax=Altererythrobacter sp. ZODW24 TaxID=2185142 RepID=UPI000DF762D2|nr:FAD-dependent oxidoreductase [Altererythrobacter sp. ZODW24]
MAANFDIAIIGAGIAGASLAAEIAGRRSVIMLEAEDIPGYHATGRSAAFWEECYGGPDIVPLTLASGDYLKDHGFLTSRGALYIGRDEDSAALDEFMERFADTGAHIERITRDRLEPMLPGLRPEWTGAVWEPACADIDVASLHAHYLARAREGGAALQTNARLIGARQIAGRWEIELSGGTTVSAGVLVNAAGAWADEVAAIAGAKPVGIAPFRRTVAQLRTDPLPQPHQPLVLDISGRFYFKPETGRVWLSPHDEEPSRPCDAAPEELAVAKAIDQLEQVMDWRVLAVERKWAGLRSFAPDRLPVYGYDSHIEGLFWFAGQGGFGIQTSPAAARFGSQLLLDLPRDDMTLGLDPSLYSPARFSG